MSEAKEAVKKEQTPKKNINWMRDKDREKVKGIFRFYEVPGGSLSFVYKAYKGDQVERYDLVDGQMYTLPLGVAKHLNKNGWYPEYSYVPGEPGMHTGFAPAFGSTAPTTMKVGRTIRRFGFQSLEFIDIEDLTPIGQPDLVTVQLV